MDQLLFSVRFQSEIMEEGEDLLQQLSNDLGFGDLIDESCLSTPDKLFDQISATSSAESANVGDVTMGDRGGDGGGGLSIFDDIICDTGLCFTFCFTSYIPMK